MAQSPAAATARAPTFAKFTDLIAFVGAQRDMVLKMALERDVRLVRFEDGRLEIALEPSASKALIGDLGQRLSALTGRRWMVIVSAAAGAATVRSQLDAHREEFRRGVQADPLVQSVLAKFPGAQIVAVRQPDILPPPAAADDDELPPEMPIDYNDGDPGFGADGPPPDYWDDL
jgi:DNA polymerase III subunit gamma/tau